MLGSGQAAMQDRLNSVDVELSDPLHWLEGRDDDALANGANLAVLGEELIQFGSAVPLGPRRFRLGKLLRGRRGTEWAMPAHAPGETFVLINPAALQMIALPMHAVGSGVAVRPGGVADDAAPAMHRIVSGEALRPPSPVHLHARVNADGSLAVRWVRRSRAGWAWMDGIEVPLGETGEKYRVLLQSPSASLTVETAVPSATIAPAQLAPLGSGPLSLSVVQVGDFAESRPATLSLAI